MIKCLRASLLLDAVQHDSSRSCFGDLVQLSFQMFKKISRGAISMDWFSAVMFYLLMMSMWPMHVRTLNFKTWSPYIDSRLFLGHWSSPHARLPNSHRIEQQSGPGLRYARSNWWCERWTRWPATVKYFRPCHFVSFISFVVAIISGLFLFWVSQLLQAFGNCLLLLLAEKLTSPAKSDE